MTNLLRLLLLLLMGGSLLAARWADDLGARPLAKATPPAPVRTVAQGRPYWPSGNWQRWARPASRHSKSTHSAVISTL